jgi:putative ABC transport system permease protein
MLRNYFITAIRHIRRSLGLSLLNILGLSLGILSCLAIYLVIRYELGYDAFHSKADRIYRVSYHREEYGGSVSFGVAPALRTDFPELESVSQVWQLDQGLVKTEGKLFEEKTYGFADENFPKIFELSWIAGNPLSALSEPNSVVLTESLANKYFGSRDPMGKVISVSKPNYHNRYELKVTGLIKDPPGNTHLPLKLIVSFSTLTKDLSPEMYNYYTLVGGSAYVLLPEHHSPRPIERRLNAFVQKHWGNEIASESRLELQPLREIHFDTRYVHSNTTSLQKIWSLAAIGFFVLLMACINFINLLTAMAGKRRKEVGIRKTLGCSRSQLIGQFLGETALTVGIAVAISLAALIAVIPLIETRFDLALDLSHLLDREALLFAGSLFVFVTAFAGLYPAFVQSAYNPSNTITGSMGFTRTFSLRNVLVFLQLSISQILVIVTLIVALQMNFMKETDLGFEKEMIVSVNLPDTKKHGPFERELKGHPRVQAYSFSSGAPSYNCFFAPFRAPSLGLTRDEVMETRFVDENYTGLFNLDLLAGKQLTALKDDQSTFSDTSVLRPVLINEVLMRKLGITDPKAAIGKILTIYWSYKVIVNGVVRDFQSESKHNDRRPCMLLYAPFRFISVDIKLNPHQVSQTMEEIGNKWSELFPDEKFKFEFLDEHIASLYRKEEKQFALFRVFATIAVIICAFGAYGLIMFNAGRRTKEIGIRKVLGARVSGIVRLLSKDFFTSAILAFVVATAIGWYLAHGWLQDFAYRIDPPWWTFLAGGLLALCVAVATVTVQSVKAAVANPVKSLRYE